MWSLNLSAPLLAGALVLCLAGTSPGFFRVVYFVGLGYAISIVVQALLAAIVYRDTISGWPLAQVLLLALYGLRLGTFLVVRDRNAVYRAQLGQTGASGALDALPARIAIWVGVSILYVLMFMPALLTLAAQAVREPLWSLPGGVALMAIGLSMEAIADIQKSAFKRRSPGQFCNVALYRFVRCPNYLGEMLFWLGAWFCALAAYRTALEWILCTAGLVCIEGIMVGAARRLEIKQDGHYRSELAYRNYVRSVPILFPFLPIYSLRRGTAALD